MFNTTRLDDRLNTGLITIALATLVGFAAHAAWNEVAPETGRPVMAQATQAVVVHTAANGYATATAGSRRAG